MKKRYLIRSLIFFSLTMYSFIAYSDHWIDLPAVIKLKYNPKDSRVIGQIDIAITSSDSNSILFYGKISDPVTLTYDFYSIHIDSIIIVGKNFYQKLDLEEGISTIRIFKKKDIWQNEYAIKILDINKDNYPDIAVYNDVMSGNKNHTFCYYLYNSKLKLFRVNYNFSLPNLIWDETNKTYSSFGQGGSESLNYTQKTYRISNDSLIAVETVKQDYDQKLDKYIKITQTAEKTKIDTLTIIHTLPIKKDGIIIKQLIDFRQKQKFADSEWHKRGLTPSDSALCANMESLFNDCTDQLIVSVKKGKTNNHIKKDLLSGFSRFDRMKYDTEESAFICDYFYELSQILGINISDDLNKWID